MRKSAFCIYAKKARISFPVTTQLISAFHFTTEIVQSIFFFNPKFQGSSNVLWLYIPFCVDDQIFLSRSFLINDDPIDLRDQLTWTDLMLARSLEMNLGIIRRLREKNN